MPYKPTGGRPGRRPGYSPAANRAAARTKAVATLIDYEEEEIVIALPIAETPKTVMKSNAKLPRSTRRERYEEMSEHWRDLINWHWERPELP